MILVNLGNYVTIHTVQFRTFPSLESKLTAISSHAHSEPEPQATINLMFL